MTQTASIIGKATARVPGSCGELAQGMVGGAYFLVTCPIDLYSTATATLYEGRGSVDAPPDAPKSRRAAELTLARCGRRDADVRLMLSSPLPRGKGMASSTADVSATIAATADALRAELPAEQIAQLALQIEPSDGVMLPGIAMLDHKKGSSIRTLGAPPPMRVVALDFGGNIDTLAFNGVNRDSALKSMEAEFSDALALIEQGIRDGSASDIGAGATLSAIANQRLLYKPQLDAALRLAEGLGAVGVNAAHSGTVLGILFEDDADLTEYAVSHVWENLLGIRQIYNRRIVSGGVVLVDADAPDTSVEASLWRRLRL